MKHIFRPADLQMMDSWWWCYGWSSCCLLRSSRFCSVHLQERPDSDGWGNKDADGRWTPGLLPFGSVLPSLWLALGPPSTGLVSVTADVLILWRGVVVVAADASKIQVMSWIKVSMEGHAVLRVSGWNPVGPLHTFTWTLGWSGRHNAGEHAPKYTVANP